MCYAQELGRPTKVRVLVLFRTTVHSPAGAKRGRKSLAPLPALTTIYVVSIKLSLDERKSLPKPKATILSVKLHLTTLQFPLYARVTLTEEVKSTLTHSLEHWLMYFYLFSIERCGFEPLQEINVCVSGDTYASSQHSPRAAGLCGTPELVVSTWHPLLHILIVLLQISSSVVLW